jgi:endonuclease/exonuclease/phosphatase family metal-dependent hydrolase
MLLKLITWNINFIHDNWLERVENINKMLENEIDDCDIIALQEATLPFSDAVTDIHTFLKRTDMKYFGSPALERNFLYNIGLEFFPKYKKYISYCLDYIMNKLLSVCGWIGSNYGESLKTLYFDHPYLSLMLMILCPIIFIGSWFFIGMMTIVNKKISCNVKSKYIGKRPIQYTDFIYNKRLIHFVNVHLPPGTKEKDKIERLNETKEIIELYKDKENVIIAGDFNEKAPSDIYVYMKKEGYKSCAFEKFGEEINTFPSNKPVKCIDFVMIKGNIKVKDVLILSNPKASDHKGIKVTLDIE